MEQTVQFLQQMQLAGFFNPASGEVQLQQNQAQAQSTVPPDKESPRNVVFSTRDANGTSPFVVQAPGGLGADVRTPRAGLSTSFSPFSPDPNLFHGGDLPPGPAPNKPETLLYHPPSSTGFAQGFGSGPVLPHDVSNTMGANGKVATPHYAGFHDNPIAATISRPPSGSLNVPLAERQEYSEMPEHHDLITDLNGMLASLDLDGVNHHQSSLSTPASAPPSAAWKTSGSNSPPAA
jgi:hypothetical protein